MGWTERLQDDIKTAMRDGDELRRDTLRMALAAAQMAEKEKHAPLTDDEGVAVVSREVRKRRESIEAFEKAGRTDLADREKAEVEVLAPYLPAPLGQDELRQLVTEAIAETGAGSARDMGRVMNALMPKVRGRADGKALSGLVATELAKADLAGHDSSGHDSGAQGVDGPHAGPREA